MKNPSDIMRSHTAEGSAASPFGELTTTSCVTEPVQSASNIDRTQPPEQWHGTDSRSMAGESLRPRFPNAMLFWVVGVSLTFTVMLVLYLSERLHGLSIGWLPLSLIIFKAVVEAWCSIYAGYFLFISAYFLYSRRRTRTARPPAEEVTSTPALAIVYLCCRDFEASCFETLCRTRTRGTMAIFVHDDSPDSDEQRRVDTAVAEAQARHGVAIHILRRPTREGGKPGALNYLLEHIPAGFAWMLVCDNDSVALDPDWYVRTAPLLNDPAVGCVQYRNVGPSNGRGVGKYLSASIDVFEVFVLPAERFGWLPFFGHNGLLRIEALRKIGGFTPGEFADDIDVSIRLALAGYCIRYKSDTPFQESHPDNYAAFRTRSYKWAYGCASVLRRWAIPLIRSRRLPLRQKFFFFVFIGFYYTQIALLGYLLASYIALPLLIPEYDFSPLYSVLGGSLVLLLMYLPTLAYFIGKDKMREWPGLAASVGLVYGSIDFVSARALIDCALRRARTWIPTNTIRATSRVPGWAWLESLIGFSILAVPFVMLPHLLYLPCSYVFALKFMAVPFLHVFYRQPMEATS